ncbi:MAG TPA: phytanoyl-CoA dioxygenase family protein [Streptosporangiaceae bacterium]
MTNPAEVVQELERSGYAVIPGRMDDNDLTAARGELSELLASAGWGSGFDGTRTKRVWALLAKTRCMDQAALDPLVLDAVERAIGPSTQFSITFATQVVPGSHQPTTGKPDPGRAVPVEMPAGSVLLFSGRLYHGAGANTSTQTRLGVVIDYQQPWLRPCEAHTLSADPAQVRKLPQRLQELLGYNQPSRYLGFINGQHPRQWLMDDYHRGGL